MIELDGSRGEGGGQMVRTALALSTVTGLPFRIKHIRAGRPRPGLKAQHLTCIKALKAISGSRARGDFLGSTELEFTPGRMNGGKHHLDVGTAGSIGLVVQSILPACTALDDFLELEITGGTDGKWALPADYMDMILAPMLDRWLELEMRIERRGYFPAGQGRVIIRVRRAVASENENEADNRLELLEPGNIVEIKIRSHASSSLAGANVAGRQAVAARERLEHLGATITEEIIHADATCPGSGIVIAARMSSGSILGADCLGEKSLRAEEVGHRAAGRLLEETCSMAAVDMHAADNLIPFLALSRTGGAIRTSRITSHSSTNAWMSSEFTGTRFKFPGQGVIEAVPGNRDV